MKYSLKHIACHAFDRSTRRLQDFLHYCQIPLDFHTSKQLSQTCGEFNANTWAEQLADAMWTRSAASPRATTA